MALHRTADRKVSESNQNPAIKAHTVSFAFICYYCDDQPKKSENVAEHQILDLAAPWDMQSVCLTTPKLQNRSCKLDLLAHAGKCKQNGALQRWESVL